MFNRLTQPGTLPWSPQGNDEVIGRNTETVGYDFSYLQKLSKDELKQQLGSILPTIDFFMEMHNAKDKVVKMDLSYVHVHGMPDGKLPSQVTPQDYSDVKDYTVHFDTLNLSKYGFPQDLEIFIHNFCTFLCAKKMHIELLLSA